MRETSIMIFIKDNFITPFMTSDIDVKVKTLPCFFVCLFGLTLRP